MRDCELKYVDGDPNQANHLRVGAESPNDGRPCWISTALYDGISQEGRGAGIGIACFSLSFVLVRPVFRCILMHFAPKSNVFLVVGETLGTKNVYPFQMATK